MLTTIKWLISIVVSLMIVWVSIVLSSAVNIAMGITAFLGLSASFAFQGLRNISNDPPQKGVATLFGARTSEVLNEGWNFFPLFPFVFGYVSVLMGRASKEFTVKVKTPDGSDSEVPVAITYRPLSGRFIEFLNSGKNAGVETQLSGKIDERVREWAIADEEGPQDWRELQKSRLEAASILTKTIGFNHVTEIPLYAQDVPTVIWMRYFTKPRPTKPATESEKEWMKDGWKRVHDVYDSLTSDQKRELEGAVNDRRGEVQRLRAGTGKIVLDDLGVTIERLNVGNIKAMGKVAEAADNEAKEKLERAAEAEELSHVRDRIKELMGAPFNYGPEQALEIVQTERGKIVKTITENKLSIAPETRDMIKEVAPEIIGTIITAFGKGGKP